MTRTTFSMCLLAIGALACVTDTVTSDVVAGTFVDPADGVPVEAMRPAAEPPIPRRAITDADFVENVARARDPFRWLIPGCSGCCGGYPPPDPSVAFELRPLDELRPAAVVRDDHGPGVMLIDRDGNGRLLRRGEYVARREVVQTDRGAYAVRWRVARIESSRLRQARDGRFEIAPSRVVFERANPIDEGAPIERREVAL